MLPEKVLNLDCISKPLKEAEYAVRGSIPARAEELFLQLKNPQHRFPFQQVVRCNIGNPQELRQKPLTFVRQVLALVECPYLMEEKNMAQTLKLFPKDAIKRAQSYFENGMVSSGSYTISQGMTFIRGHVAQFIERRDGFPSDPNKIFLTNGASQAVTFVLQLLISGLDVGIMIPTPQYPLYSATLTLLNGVSCPYYLDEDDDWSISINELRRSIQQARQGGTNVRALVVINPGNPVGNCISVARMEETVDFCVAENLVLLADEVYQENTYNSALPFASFKRVKERMGGRHRDLELFSFHSTSKGFFGECGKRGGYVELSGIDPEVEKQLLKLASIGLCSSVAGQITTDLMVDPPAPGEESYELFVQEKQSIIDSLKRRARRLVEVFNSLEAVTCNPAQGALYTFPQVRLSKKAIAEAERRGMTPDAFYCLQLLENTGVSTVPGSGFGQKEGTFHFRCTFLPQEEEFDCFTELVQNFHKRFMEEYSDNS